MLNELKTSTIRNLTNAKGWRTDRRIVVIESDDWGSIRIPNKRTLEFLSGNNFAVEKCGYVMNDSLESNNDLEILFDLIQRRRKTPIITANFLTANPDFDRIREANFEQYYSESLERTLSRYPNHDRVKELWLKGSTDQFFVPQLHGREHLNISQWMSDLEKGNKETQTAFDLGVFGISAHIVTVKRNSYQAAFGNQKPNYKVDLGQVLTEAFEDFEKLFGFKSKTFIAPNYTWNDEVEKVSASLGITHLQGVSAQRIPICGSNKPKIKRNFLGERNRYGQKYLIRNVSFEPFESTDKDCVSMALKEIKNAFLWKKPAVISMHRVNFIGSINPYNREMNLKLFNELLDKIDQHWPDVEYLSSKDLAEII